MNKNYYKILEVSETASEDELQKSYRRLAKIYHPDLNENSKEAEEKFKEINEAYRVLGNPQTRKQYDMGTYNPANQTTNTATNSNDNIFNELFQDSINRYNKEREDYIKFLDEMEAEFNKYNRSLKKEKENALNTDWSLLNSLDSFYQKKFGIRNELNDLKRNVEAFDDFLVFFKEAQKEIAQYGANFNPIKQYIEPSQKGVLSADFYLGLKSKMRSSLYEIQRKLKEFDEFMQFLDEMEEKFNQFNKTLKNVKEKEKDMRGKLSVEQIYAKQQDIRSHLFVMERRADAFDRFSEYYIKANQEIQTLYGGRLINCDGYLNPNNRVSFDPEVLLKKQCQITNVIFDLKLKRIDKIRQLKEELEKRNLNFYTYLAAKNIDEFTISIPAIEIILKSMELIDQINAALTSFGMTIEDLLKLKGRTLIDMNYEELLNINDASTIILITQKRLIFRA